MRQQVDVWQYEIEPRRHRIAWWIVRPLVALCFVSIIGIPLGLLIAAAATKPWQEHKAWKQAKKGNRA